MNHATIYSRNILIKLQVSATNGREGLYVGLQRYYNEFNLKYIPDKGVTPYCCCGFGNDCFTSTDASNLTIRSCTTQCMLRFTLCAEMQTGKDSLTDRHGVSLAPICYESEVRVAPPLVVFDQCSSSSSKEFFPSQDMALNFIFPFERAQQNVRTHKNNLLTH